MALVCAAAALTRRLQSTTSTTHRPRIFSPVFSRSPLISFAVRSLPLVPARFIGNCPSNLVSTLGDWEITQLASNRPGMDFQHWFIFMEKPHEAATKHELIDLYIKTLAKVVGSEEEDKKKIYKLNYESSSIRFGCEIDWETADKLRVLPGVFGPYVESYTYPQNKDYGGDALFVNGELVRRSPGGQRRIRKFP